MKLTALFLRSHINSHQYSLLECHIAHYDKSSGICSQCWVSTSFLNPLIYGLWINQ